MNFTTQTERDYRADDWDRMWNAFPRPCGEVERIMSEIKRYEFHTPGRSDKIHDWHDDAGVDDSPTGGYVLFTDHQQALAEKDGEIEKLREANKILGDAITTQGQAGMDDVVEIAALKKRIHSLIRGSDCEDRFVHIEDALRVLAGHLGPESDRQEVERLIEQKETGVKP